MAKYNLLEIEGNRLPQGTLVETTYQGSFLADGDGYLFVLPPSIVLWVDPGTLLAIGATFQTPAPVIDDPLAHGQTVVTGTVSMSNGGGVGVFIDDVLSGEDTNVVGGVFSATVPALEEDQVVTAKALAPEVGATLSDASTPETVLRPDAPVLEDPIDAGATSVSGTTTESNGTIIEVFVDDVSVGTVEVSASPDWTKSGLTALVADEVITATATNAKGTSEASDPVTVTAP